MNNLERPEKSENRIKGISYFIGSLIAGTIGVGVAAIIAALAFKIVSMIIF